MKADFQWDGECYRLAYVKKYNLKKLDDMSLAILRILSRFYAQNKAARAKHLYEAYISKAFPDYTYQQMISRLQKLGRAELIEKHYKEEDLLFQKAYWKITKEGLLRIMPQI